MAYVPSMGLKMHHLDKIDRFEKYTGVISDLRTVSIVFHVKYKDGSGGYVFGGSTIPGKPLSGKQLREALDKVKAAKALLEDDEWHYLEQKHRITRDRVLVLSDS